MTTSHGPLYYRTDGNLVHYTCDCGEETAGFQFLDQALAAMGQHLKDVGE